MGNLVDVKWLQDGMIDRIGFKQGSTASVEPHVARRLQQAGMVTMEAADPAALDIKTTARIGGLMRVRNEARWIKESVTSLLRAAPDGIVVFDDNSTDDTWAIVYRVLLDDAKLNGGVERITLMKSPWSRGEGVNEPRDKDAALHHLMERYNPDWCVCIDGDEVLTRGAERTIAGAAQHGMAPAFSFKVEYLWDTPDRVRVDGIYGNFYRPSMFFTRGYDLTFKRTTAGGGFHCSNVPEAHLKNLEPLKVRLKHYGYIDSGQRVDKYHWYNSIDPSNQAEDCYRHMVQGDIPEIPADAELKHAGPVRFAPWVE